VTRKLRFLTAEQVVVLHDALIERDGGSLGGGARGAGFEGVDAAVQAVKNSYYESLEELAAAYAVYIVQGHVFLDGNKRTGAASMLVFLEAHGVRLRIPAERLAAMMIELQERAAAGASAADLVDWIAGVIAAGRSRRPRSRRRR
jgi:death-on-curing protein